jgi:hypothetical protein
MSKRDDYLHNAGQALHLANRVSPVGRKFLLFDLAEKWLDLADRIHHRSTHTDHQNEEHPLVKRAFRYFRA